MDANKKTRYQVALGLAVAGVMLAVAPATQAQAATADSTVSNSETRRLAYPLEKSDAAVSNFEKSDTTKTQTTTTATQPATQVPFIDNSTPGNKNKVLIHCIERYTKKPMQDVLLDYTTSSTGTGETRCTYLRPVISGYLCGLKGVWGITNPYNDFTTSTPGFRFEFTLEYQNEDVRVYMKDNWTCIDNKWYFNETGKDYQKGWYKMGNRDWFLFDYNTGATSVGWVQDNGKWYYFYSTGEMASGTTIDGYTLGADGAML